MKIIEFKKMIQRDESIESIEYRTLSGEKIETNQRKIPDSLMREKFFTAIVSTRDEDGIFQDTHSIENLNSNSDDESDKPVLRQETNSELERARLFYESLTKINNDAYERIHEANREAMTNIVDIISKNEEVLDRRINKFMKTYSNENKSLIDGILEEGKEGEETNPISNLTPIIETIAKTIIGKLLPQEEGNDE